MTFALPGVLLFGLPLWLAGSLAVWSFSRRRAEKLRVLAGAFAPEERTPGYRPGARAGRLALRLAALGLLVVALARPQWGVHWVEVRNRGLDLVILLDTSRSMLAPDAPPSRLQQAKWGIHDLLGKLRGDRVGLVPFAGGAVMTCPPTADYAAVAMFADDAHVGMIPRGGTDVGRAIDVALEQAFPEKEDEESAGEESDKVILLITDGEDLAGGATNRIETLKARGIRVCAVGIGTAEGELLPGEGDGGYFKDRKGAVVKTRLDEGPLKALALATGGTYARAAAGDTGVERIVADCLEGLKRGERESRIAEVREERYAVFALAAFLLLLLEAVPASVVRAKRQN
ncbi:MAG: VWA domain-containing protein [Kiritimatiellae bacterium]|nr:VWA domain-containing protein [Kiritimatiellia bacterium]